VCSGLCPESGLLPVTFDWLLREEVPEPSKALPAETSHAEVLPAEAEPAEAESAEVRRKLLQVQLLSLIDDDFSPRSSPERGLI
jgi:hypothetical protein